jgi:Protein of unknown function (DUF4242)
MPNVIVERTFTTPLTDEEHGRSGKKLDACLEIHGARWLRSYLSSDRLRMVCEFEGGDAESVREAHRSAGAPFDRVWTAEVYKID